MELLQIVTDYFGLNAISTAETFPELIDAFLSVFCAVMIVLVIIRTMINATWRIKNDLAGGR